MPRGRACAAQVRGGMQLCGGGGNLVWSPRRKRVEAWETKGLTYPRGGSQGERGGLGWGGGLGEVREEICGWFGYRHKILTSGVLVRVLVGKDTLSLVGSCLAGFWNHGA